MCGVAIGYYLMIGFVHVLSFFCMAGTCAPMLVSVHSIFGGIYGVIAGFVVAVIASVQDKFPTGIALISLVFPLGVVLGIELLDDFFYGSVFIGFICSVLVFYINSMIGSLNVTEKRKNDEKAKQY